MYDTCTSTMLYSRAIPSFLYVIILGLLRYNGLNVQIHDTSVATAIEIKKRDLHFHDLF